MDLARIKRLVKEVGWVAIGQAVTVLGSLVLVRVLTEYLEPTEYGQLALGLTLAGLVNQLVMGGVMAGIGRFYPIAVERDDLNGYLHASHRLVGYAATVVAIMAIALVVGFSWFGYFQWIGLSIACLVYAVLSGYNAVLGGIQNAARQRAVVAIHGGADAWLKILLAVGIVLWLGASSTAVVIGYSCSSLLITVSQLICLRRTIPQQHTPTSSRQQWISEIWAYAFPFTTWGAFTWMQQVSDRWALQTFTTVGDVGQYAVLVQLGYTPIALVTGMTMSFLGPILYQRSGDAADHVRNTSVHRIGWRMTYLSLVITLLGFLITFALHDWIFGLLVAFEYRGSSHLLPWVVLAGGMFAAGQILALKLMSEMKPSAMSSAKIVTALIGVLLNVIGAAFAGMSGVVGALVVFSGTYFVWMVVLGRSSIKA